MKHIMMLLGIGMLSLSVQAQKLTAADVPAAAKESFAKQFPKAKEVQWSKENESEFEAEFEVADVEQSANFDAAGKWLGTETEIKKSALPAPVQQTIAKQFAGYKVDEAEKAESAEGLHYEVELKKDKKALEVTFAPDGKVLKQKDAKAEADEKD